MNIRFYLLSLVGFISSFFTKTLVFSFTPSRSGSIPTEIMLNGRHYVIHEGDMLMDADVFELMKENLTMYGNVATDPRVRWPTRNIPYTIEPYVYNQREIQIIQAGLQYLQKYTCLTFEHVEREDTRFKIYVTKTAPGGGCYSEVGYQKQVVFDTYGNTINHQIISLGPSCVTEEGVEHEFMHALGLAHEQSRPDRDKYINIYWDNILPEKFRTNFHVFNPSTTYDFPYDYGSAMHYERYAFSGNGRRTIEAKLDNRICLGNIYSATDCDILKVRILYGCERKGERTCKPVIQYQDRNGRC